LSSTPSEDELLIKDAKIKALLYKIKTVVKLFRRSPTKNDEVLQKHVIDEFKKELTFILDTKTRWNSLLDMLARVLICSLLTFEQSEWGFMGSQAEEINISTSQQYLAKIIEVMRIENIEHMNDQSIEDVHWTMNDQWIELNGGGLLPSQNA
jgi:hypothetical protein